MFARFPNPLSVDTSEIFIIGPNFNLCYGSMFTALKNRKFYNLLIINYPVSYNVDKAYKVILDQFLEVLGQKRHSTE